MEDTTPITLFETELCEWLSLRVDKLKPNFLYIKGFLVQSQKITSPPSGSPKWLSSTNHISGFYKVLYVSFPAEPDGETKTEKKNGSGSW